MKTIPLPLLGVDMLSDETELRAGTARKVVNVDLGAKTMARRQGYETVLPGFNFTGIAEWRGRTLLGRGTELCELDLADMSVTPLCSTGPGPLDFHEYASSMYVASRGALWRVPALGQPVLVGVRVPALPEVVAHAYGTLTPGRYAVAISLVNAMGEESAAHMLGSYQLSAGLRLTGLPVLMDHRWRIYLTPPDGDVLYLAEEVPALLAQHVVTVYPGGQPCEVLDLRPMPAGDFVRGHAGRLYVARGDTLWFSQPMRPHLHHPGRNFIRFHGAIRFVEVLDGGAYVGDDAGVWWLGGVDPLAWEMRRASDALALRRSSLILAGENASSARRGAVWLSTEGYQLGGGDGTIRPMQPGRIFIDGRTEGRSVFLVRDGVKQVITLTAAHPASVFGEAIDSTTST